MRFARTLVGIIVIAAACGGDGGIVDPNDEELIPGLTLTASVVVTDVTENTGSRVKVVHVEVLVRNTTDETIEHHYPSGCPVRMRLYDRNTDALLYDQTVAGCNVTAAASLSLGPQESRTLTSGDRFPWEVGGAPWEIGGVTIAPDTYRATAVLRLTGENPIELEAGTYRLPACIVVAFVPSCD